MSLEGSKETRRCLRDSGGGGGGGISSSTRIEIEQFQL